MKATRIWSLLAGSLLCLFLLAQGVTEEVPLGGVQGLVTMSENGRPLPGATVMLRPVVEAEYTRIRSAETDAAGAFHLRNLPAGEYTIEAYAKAHSLGESRITIAEGAPTALQLDLKPQAPHLDLYASQRVFTPAEEPQFEAHGFAELDAIQVEVFSLDIQAVAKEGGIDDVVYALAYPGNREPNPLARLGTKVATFDHTITRRDGEGVFIEYVKVPKLAPGLYWVRCTAGPARKATFLNVTSLSLVAKSARGEALCFASDIVTGQPLAGTQVSYLGENGLAEGGITGADGIVKFPLAGAPKQGRTAMIASSGASRAVVGFYSDANPETATRIFIYTDRPVYRPGDTVKFKGIVRRLEGLKYAMVPPQTATASLIDSEGAAFKTLDLAVDARGTFHGEFSISAEARPAPISMEVAVGEATTTQWISVSAYRKPEFTVVVEPERPYYVRGDRAKMTVKCEYYHGGPVVGAKVSASISKSPYWSYAPMDSESDDGSEDASYSDYGEYVDSVDATTDARGIAVISFPTRQDNEPETLENDQVYSVQAWVEAPGGKYFDGKGAVRVTRGEFGLAVLLDEYIATSGQPVVATVHATAHPDDRPVAGQSLSVRVGREDWNGRDVRFIEEQRMAVTTGADGTARIEFRPKRPGSTVIKVSGDDRRGNEVIASEYVWVEGPGAAPSRPLPKANITVRLDKPSYHVGDRAKVLLRTSESGGTALVTVEGDRIYASTTVAIENGAAVVDLPVEAAFAPNAFVSVAYVHGKQFMEATRRLAVNLDARVLQVDVRPEKSVVQPGDTVAYTITTKDDRGQPVSADVSLGVVDEAIYAIAPDTTNIVEAFYPKRYNAVSTGYSFPEVYLDGGDKAPKDLKVRTKFLDTAYWNPSVTTDAAGSAVVRVTLPDNITQWRATAVAATQGTAVGMGSSKLRARKPLMVRLSAPAFLVQRDRRTVTAVVSNDTGADAKVEIEIASSGVALEGSLRRTLSIKNGGQAQVALTAAARQTGTARITAKAWIAGGAMDGVEATLPVKAFGRAFAENRAGEIDGVETIPFIVRPGADPGTGRVVITLSPTLAASMLSSLDSLIDYPYGCVEQTMSRFMPALVVDQTVRALGLPAPPRLAELPRITADSLTRLATMQHGDGGWGWWENDESDPEMTAYVLEGLHRARAAGFDTRGLEMRALDWAVRSFKQNNARSWSRALRLALLVQLEQWGHKEFALAQFESENLQQADAQELAYAIQFAQAASPDLVDSLVKRLVDKASGSGSFAWWEESRYGHETTAMALETLAAVRPAHPLLPRVVRWLLAERRGDGWVSTRDTAHILLALARYLPTTGELTAKGAMHVIVNGAQRTTVALDASLVVAPRIEIPIRDLRVGENTIRLQREGAGRAYYTFEGTQTVATERLGMLVNGSGIEVSRRYLRLEPRRMEDGTLRLVDSERAVDRVQAGDVLTVEVTLRSREDREYMLIEDPIPSGFRIVDRGAIDPYEEWVWWYSQMDAYDDRMAVFARHLPRGTQTFRYTIRAENVGIAHALPCRAFDMYRPEVFGSSSETVVEVQR
ncbi:MAG: carboxypeptidase regulatory-like domain-containing protein [Chthonomonadaceae bacterium]|nr:carboxypeptidase regulatory-like domain-containing protein [Chthonomonadaceae bacterium]